MTAVASYRTEDYAQAAHTLAIGQLLAFPTETVYGLGADACNPAALARLFALKGRPTDHPVIVHIAEHADPAQWLLGALPPLARRLIDAFWPGPLTLILKRAPAIPDAVSGGQDTIGLRSPAHPVAQALLRAFSAIPRLADSSLPSGIAAPSANRFGRVSPTTAEHVRNEFGQALTVLDAGACQVGLESTILDVSQDRLPILLRAGQIHAAQIAEVIGEWPAYKEAVAGQQDIPRASGTLKAHYAPNIPLGLCTASELPAMLLRYPAEQRVAWVSYSPHAEFSAQDRCNMAADGGRDNALTIQTMRMPAQPDAYAHLLYRVLRDLEATDRQRIWVERPPADDDTWAAIHDRLSRAAAAFGNQ